MALALATSGQGAEATTRPGEVAWACPRCPGVVLAYIRGRTVTLPSGDRFGGVAFVEVRCPACRRLARKWLVPTKRSARKD
jgi:hypothetical protein